MGAAPYDNIPNTSSESIRTDSIHFPIKSPHTWNRELGLFHQIAFVRRWRPRCRGKGFGEDLRPETVLMSEADFRDFRIQQIAAMAGAFHPGAHGVFGGEDGVIDDRARSVRAEDIFTSILCLVTGFFEAFEDAVAESGFLVPDVAVFGHGARVSLRSVLQIRIESNRAKAVPAALLIS